MELEELIRKLFFSLCHHREFHYYDAGEDWRDATGAGRSSLALVFLVPHNCQGYIILAHLLVVSNKLTRNVAWVYTYRKLRVECYVMHFLRIFLGGCCVLGNLRHVLSVNEVEWRVLYLSMFFVLVAFVVKMFLEVG